MEISVLGVGIIGTVYTAIVSCGATLKLVLCKANNGAINNNNTTNNSNNDNLGL